MKQENAKQLIFIAWKRWLDEHGEISEPNGNDAFLFYLKLETRRDTALSFRCKGDKWQTVHAWLLEEDFVKD